MFTRHVGSRGQRLTNIPATHVETCEDAAVSRVRRLGHQQGHASAKEGARDANDDARYDKHGNVEGARLQADPEAEPEVAKEDGGLAAEAVGAPRDKGEEDDGAEVLRAADEAEPGPSGMIRELLPVRECQQAVQHGPIISIARGEHEEVDNAEVEEDQVPLLVPWLVT